MNKNKKLVTIIASAAAALVVVGGVLTINLSSNHGGPALHAGTTQTSGPDLNAGSTAPSATATTPAADASAEPAADNSGDWAKGMDAVTLNVPFADGQTSVTVGGVTVDCTKEQPAVVGATATGASFMFASEADKTAQKNATSGSCTWGGDAVDDFVNSNN